MKVRFFSSIICCFIIYSCSNNSGEDNSANIDSTLVNKEQQIKNLVAKFPDSALLQERLVQYYRDNENYTAALATTNAILQKDSSSDRWWDIRATLYSETDDTTNAIISWEKAASLNPEPKYLLPLGYLYADLKNPKALFIAQLLINSDSSKMNKEAMLISGIYYNKADKQKAISFFDKALQSSYTFMAAYREKAMVLYDLAKYKEAMEVLKRALSIQSTYDEGWYWLGRCYEKLNDKEHARESYQHAIDFSRETENGEYQDAIDALNKLNAIE